MSGNNGTMKIIGELVLKICNDRLRKLLAIKVRCLFVTETGKELRIHLIISINDVIWSETLTSSIPMILILFKWFSDLQTEPHNNNSNNVGIIEIKLSSSSC